MAVVMDVELNRPRKPGGDQRQLKRLKKAVAKLEGSILSSFTSEGMVLARVRLPSHEAFSALQAMPFVYSVEPKPVPDLPEMTSWTP